MLAAGLGLQRVLRVDGQLVSERGGQRGAAGPGEARRAEPARRLTWGQGDTALGELVISTVNNSCINKVKLPK